MRDGAETDRPKFDIPAPPALSESTKWTTVSLQGRYWLNYSKGRGEDRYFISKGGRRIVETFPFTNEGWAAAWHRFEELEPDASRVYALEIQQREQRRRGGAPIRLGSKAVYMGGLPEHPGTTTGTLWLSETALGLGETRPEKMTIPLPHIESVDIADGTVSKSKVGATLAFGILGAAGSRGSKTEVSIVAHLKSGGAAYYLLRDSPEGRLAIRAKAGPILQRAGIPFADQVSTPQAVVDIGDQLQKLSSYETRGF